MNPPTSSRSRLTLHRDLFAMRRHLRIRRAIELVVSCLLIAAVLAAVLVVF